MLIKYMWVHQQRALKTGSLSKKITIIGINYYPEDSAIGLYTTQKAEDFASKGHQVTVITGFPYYPQWEIQEKYKSKPYFLSETINGVNVLRCRQYVPTNPTFFKRIIHLISFTLGSFINIFRVSKPDLVISIVPFTSSILLGWFLKLRYKSKLWVHVQDFEFDAALQTGVSNKGKGIYSFLFKLEKWLFSKADVSSTISDSMLSRLETKTNSERFFLPNWIDEKKINPETAIQHKYLISNKLKILYSGNIGDKQDWNVFVQFCNDLDDTKYEVIIVGDGAKKAWLIEQIKKLNVISYYPPVEYEELSSLLCSADLHILFQKSDVIDTVMPSKILGMMASGKPSLVLGSEYSEVKTIFENSKAGLFYNNYSKSLINELDKLMNDPLECKKMGEDARNFVISNFSKQYVLSRMIQKVDSLLQTN